MNHFVQVVMTVVPWVHVSTVLESIRRHGWVRFED
jgi:hypothetical protein